jgi:hypothetical protein
MHSETSVYFNETTRLYISEGLILHTRSRQNLKYHQTQLSRLSKSDYSVQMFMLRSIATTDVFSTASTRSVEPSQVTLGWVQATHSSGTKESEREAHHTPSSNADVKIARISTSVP